MFLDDPDGSVRDAIHPVFANEMVLDGEAQQNPGLDKRENTAAFQVLDLNSLVQIKLTAYRDKDRTHVRDLIEVGLVDETLLPMLPETLSARLKRILDDPND